MPCCRKCVKNACYVRLLTSVGVEVRAVAAPGPPAWRPVGQQTPTP